MRTGPAHVAIDRYPTPTDNCELGMVSYCCPKADCIMGFWFVHGAQEAAVAVFPLGFLKVRGPGPRLRDPNPNQGVLRH